MEYIWNISNAGGVGDGAVSAVFPLVQIPSNNSNKCIGKDDIHTYDKFKYFQTAIDERERERENIRNNNDKIINKWANKLEWTLNNYVYNVIVQVLTKVTMLSMYVFLTLLHLSN